MIDNIVPRRSITDQLIRGLYMILFAIIADISLSIIGLIAVFQFIYSLITARLQRNAVQFGEEMSGYLARIVQFLTYNTESKPWPFDSWG